MSLVDFIDRANDLNKQLYNEKQTNGSFEDETVNELLDYLKDILNIFYDAANQSEGEVKDQYKKDLQPLVSLISDAVDDIEQEVVPSYLGKLLRITSNIYNKYGDVEFPEEFNR